MCFSCSVISRLALTCTSTWNKNYTKWISKRNINFYYEIRRCTKTMVTECKVCLIIKLMWYVKHFKERTMCNYRQISMPWWVGLVGTMWMHRLVWMYRLVRSTRVGGWVAGRARDGQAACSPAQADHLNLGASPPTTQAWLLSNSRKTLHKEIIQHTINLTFKLPVHDSFFH